MECDRVQSLAVVGILEGWDRPIGRWPELGTMS